MSEKNTYNLSLISKRYAGGFLELAEKQDSFDSFYHDLCFVCATIEQNSELKNFLEHPLILAEDKKEIVQKLFENYIGVYSLNFLKLLIDKNRIFLFSTIKSHYKALLDKKRNISTAKVVSAIELDEETLQRLKNKLETLLNKTVELSTSVDTGIIAGVIVKIEDKIIDGSIKTRFENMKKQLI